MAETAFNARDSAPRRTAIEVSERRYPRVLVRLATVAAAVAGIVKATAAKRASTSNSGWRQGRMLLPSSKTPHGGLCIRTLLQGDVDWSVLDEFIAEHFVAHNPPIPGVTLDREGMKQAAEIFRRATPGDHEIKLQVAEDDLVVSHIAGRGVHAGELLGIPATNKQIESDGIAIHRIRDGKIVEYWAVVDVASILQQVGVLPGPPA